MHISMDDETGRFYMANIDMGLSPREKNERKNKKEEKEEEDDDNIHRIRSKRE